MDHIEHAMPGTTDEHITARLRENVYFIPHVRPSALPGHLQDGFSLILRKENPISDELRTERLQRAIRVVYRPETERVSHYYYARLADQFDAVPHIDETHALQPLERESDPAS